MNDAELLKEKIKSLREKVRGLNILVVDDEKLIREKTGIFMEKFFNQVNCAEDGNIALKMFNKDVSYDIVITDLQMPNMTGQELIKELSAIDPDLFIAVMTGTPNLDDEILQKCNICLEKPVGLENMFAMMELLIKKKKL